MTERAAPIEYSKSVNEVPCQDAITDCKATHYFVEEKKKST